MEQVGSEAGGATCLAAITGANLDSWAAEFVS
jgi:hypothetical protein